jgi:hypothetical protein
LKNERRDFFLSTFSAPCGGEIFLFDETSPERVTIFERNGLVCSLGRGKKSQIDGTMFAREGRKI